MRLDRLCDTSAGIFASMVAKMWNHLIASFLGLELVRNVATFARARGSN